MGVFRTPKDPVYTTVHMYRWQKEWINSRHSVNFSGLVQEIIIELMREYDPDYFEANKQHLNNHTIQRKDAVDVIIKRHPEIVNQTI